MDNPYTSLSRLSLARYAARRGRLDEALEWIQDAMNHGIDPGSAGRLATNLAPLRQDAQFRALAERGRNLEETAPRR